MMPHPERVIRAVQNAWHPDDWGEEGPLSRASPRLHHNQQASTRNDIDSMREKKNTLFIGYLIRN